MQRSDGTEVGTVLISSLRYVVELMPTNTTFFLRAARNNTDIELFKSDGTDIGTQRVKDINSNGSSMPTLLRTVNDRLYFLANDGSRGMELWTSNGIGCGTILVKEIGASGPSAMITMLGDLSGRMMFWERDAGLTSTDGTLNGTQWLAKINPAQVNQAPSGVTKLGNRLLFDVGYSNSAGATRAIWITDGTNAGTIRVRDFELGSTDSFATFVQQTLFVKSSAAQGREIWKTDGTAAGKKLVRDTHADGTRGETRSLATLKSAGPPVEANGKLYFNSPDPLGNLQVRQTNGTSGDNSPLC